MAGFIRRFGFIPDEASITSIEGVIIADQAPPGAVLGVSSGVVAMIGEFADMAFAISVDTAGVVTTHAQPVEIFSAQDMSDKVGGFDPTIGNTGNNGGNGFISLRNKQFTRLVLVPINLASAGGGRAWRDLPTNLSATQAQPVVPLLGGIIAAGREFKTGVNRVHIGTRVSFTALGHYKNGIDGAVTSVGPAATQTFNSATGGFLTARNGGVVQKGDILVVGVIGAAGAQGANAFTYRVTADAVSNTALVVEKLDGANFDWTTGTALAYRLHPPSDADSAGLGGGQFQLSDVGGYKIPARPLDATIAAATSIPPVLVPPAATATSWDTLSGLTLRSHHTAGFVFVSTIQAPNAANDATIDALYSTAIDALLQDAAPSRDVNILLSSRTSSTIRSKVKSHVLTASGQGVGRMGIITPNLQTVSLATVIGTPDPGVGANRDERVIYSWPGAQTFVPEAVGVAQGIATGLTTTDGILDVPGDGWLAAVLSNLAPEKNPGLAGPPVNTILAPIIGIQRAAPVLGLTEYTSLRANGICGLRIDRVAGPIFQSGITTSLIAGQKNIARRRMADFIQDSIADRLNPLSKQPLTQAWKDSVVGEVDAFLNSLLSPTNPPAQRIAGYQIDDKSGNTPALEARGIFVVIARVRTLASADFIVLQTEIGEGVVLANAA